MEHSHIDADRQRHTERKSSREITTNQSRRNDHSKHFKTSEPDSIPSKVDPSIRFKPENEEFKFKSSTPKTSIDNLSKQAELDPQYLEFRKLIKLLPRGFLEDYLNKILRFLKGGSKEICFPNLTPSREAFLVKIASDQNNLKCEQFSSTCRNICKDILRVLQSQKNAFQWIYSFESGMEKEDVLVYQKDFFNKKKQESKGHNLWNVIQSISDKESRHLSSLDLGLSSEDEMDVRWYNRCVDSETVKLTKRQRSYQELFSSLTLPFIMSSLQTVVDFLQDDERLTLEFKYVTSYEARYLKCINIFPRKEGLSCLLDKECSPLVKQLKKGLLDQHLKVVEGKAGLSKLRTVIVKKRLGSGVRKRRVTNKFNSARSNDDKRSNKDRNSGSRYSHQSSSGIKWQAEGAPPASPTPGCSAPAAHASSSKRSKRHSKLAKAFSVPVQSEVAVKMMRLMGWEGGALGVRGEGIVEPIMPALDIVQGAGLGHSPAGKNRPGRRDQTARKERASGEKPSFRLDMLNNMLDFVKEPKKQSTTITFPNPLTHAEKKYLQYIISGVNGRDGCRQRSNLTERNLVGTILDALEEDPLMRIRLDLSKDLREATFNKRVWETPIQPAKCNNDAPKQNSLSPITNYPNLQNMVVVTYADIQDRIKTLKTEVSIKESSLQGLAYRITFFQQILDFVRSANNNRKVVFQDVLLTSKQLKFIDNIVDHINRRKKCSYSSAIENGLLDDIKNEIDCSLQISFSSDFRYFTLMKVNFETKVPKLKSAVIENLKYNNKYSKNDEAMKIVNPVAVAKETVRSQDIPNSDGSLISLECCYILSSDDEIMDRADKLAGKSDTGEKITAAYNHGLKIQVNSDEFENTNAEVLTDTGGERSESVDVCEQNMEEVKITSELEMEIANVSLNSSFDVELAEKLMEADSMSDATIIQPKENFQENIFNTVYTKIEFKKNEKDLIDDLKSKIFKEDVNEKDSIKDFEVKKYLEIPVYMPKRITLKSPNNIEENINPIDIDGNPENDNKFATNETVNNEETINIKQDDIEIIINNNEVEGDNKVTSDINDTFYEVPSPGSGKRSRSMSQTSDIIENKRARMKSAFKEIYVTISNNAITDIDIQLAVKIQEQILKSIEDTAELPFLKCHGLIDGVLYYECGNTDSLDFLKDCIRKVCIEDVSLTVFESTKEAITKKRNRIKMAVKTNSFLVEDPKNIFKRMEIYNSGINTKNWIILDAIKNNVFNIEVDYDSFELISDFNYCLDAGMDRVEFSRIW